MYVMHILLFELSAHMDLPSQMHIELHIFLRCVPNSKRMCPTDITCKMEHTGYVLQVDL